MELHNYLLDLLYTGYWALIFIIIGTKLCLQLSPDSFKYRFLLSPTFGSLTVTWLSSILYASGLSTRFIFWIISSFALIFLPAAVQQLKRLIILGRKSKTETSKTLIVTTLAGLFLFLPKLLGGLQFTSVRGLAWDQMEYLSASAAMAKNSWHYMQHLSNELFRIGEVKSLVENPLLLSGASNLLTRPAIMITYAVTSHLNPTGIYRNHYDFLCLLLFNLNFCLTFLITQITSASLFRALAFASCSVLGFFGQWVLDNSLWSQIGALSMIFGGLAMSFVLQGKNINLSTTPSNTNSIWHWVLLGFLISGSMIMHPESAIIFFFAASVLPSLRILQFFRLGLTFEFIKKDFSFLLAELGGFLFTLLMPNTWSFIVRQITIAKAGGYNSLVHNTFASLFPHNSVQAPLPFYPLVDFIMGAIGLHQLAPGLTTPASGAIAAYFFWAIILVILFIIKSRSIKKIILSKKTSAASLNFIVFISVISALILFFYCKGSTFSAFRILMISLPLTLIFLALPFLNSKSKSLLFYPMETLLITAGLSLAISRPIWAYEEKKFRLPSPIGTDSGLPPNERVLLDWNVDALLPKIMEYDGIEIDVENIFLERFLMIYFYSNGLKFYTIRPIYNSYEKSSGVLGNQIPIKGKIARVYLTKPFDNVSSDPFRRLSISDLNSK